MISVSGVLQIVKEKLTILQLPFWIVVVFLISITYSSLTMFTQIKKQIEKLENDPSDIKSFEIKDLYNNCNDWRYLISKNLTSFSEEKVLDYGCKRIAEEYNERKAYLVNDEK
jgi:hypothetical protein